MCSGLSRASVLFPPKAACFVAVAVPDCTCCPNPTTSPSACWRLVSFLSPVSIDFSFCVAARCLMEVVLAARAFGPATRLPVVLGSSSLCCRWSSGPPLGCFQLLITSSFRSALLPWCSLTLALWLVSPGVVSLTDFAAGSSAAYFSLLRSALSLRAGWLGPLRPSVILPPLFL